MLKRDTQGKFVLKDNDYRQVHSLRLTDETWKALGVIAEGFGMTKADYLSEVVRNNAHPSITRDDEPDPQGETTVVKVATTVPSKPLTLATLETLRNQVMVELKLGKQAPGYKAALKALNHFIGLLTSQYTQESKFANSQYQIRRK
ncbi:MAG: hypothetical protein PUP92_16305 [Rhizonema sp. PD38]|nr:hypothetical protein [Rhizonema sp. PD38]